METWQDRMQGKCYETQRSFGRMPTPENLTKLVLMEGTETKIIDLTTGSITRKRNGEVDYLSSAQWYVTGVSIRNNFGHVVERISLVEFAKRLFENEACLFTKRGKAKFTFEDVDHGTKRTWGKRYRYWECRVSA